MVVAAYDQLFCPVAKTAVIVVAVALVVAAVVLAVYQMVWMAALVPQVALLA